MLWECVTVLECQTVLRKCCDIVVGELPCSVRSPGEGYRVFEKMSSPAPCRLS